MKVGIRTKIALLLGTTIFLMLTFYTFQHMRVLKAQYIQAVTWQADALSQSLSFLVQDMDIVEDGAKEALFAQTDSLSAYCKRLYEASGNRNLSHIALIDRAGTVVAHNDPSAVNSTVDTPGILELLGNYRITPIFDRATNIYHTLMPILDVNRAYIGAIDVGFFGGGPRPGSQGPFVTRRSGSSWALFCSPVLSCSSQSTSWLTQPIKYLVKVGERLADGYPIHSLKSAQSGG